MASTLAIELHFLIEHLISENSPLVENIRKVYNPILFSDLINFWKSFEAYTQQLNDLTRSVQQLCALTLQSNQSFLPYPIYQVFDPSSGQQPISTSTCEEKQIQETKKNKKTVKRNTTTAKRSKKVSANH